MMRPLLIIGILLALPALYLGYNDYIKYTQKPNQGFVPSTIGEVWLDHDRPGFMQFKAKYTTREREWDQEIRPKLEWEALSIAIVPPALYLGWVFICWLLGRGPFAGMSNTIRREAGGQGGFSHSSSNDRSNKISYRRK